MKAFRFAAAPLLVALVALASSADASVKEACKKATEGSEYYGYCVSLLQPSASSGKDDLLSLSLAAADLSRDRFSDNLLRIDQLLARGGLDKPSQRALHACENVYTRGTLKLMQASDCLKVNNFYGASNYLSNARDEAVSCGDVFTKFGITSLLQAENDESLKRCYVAIHIAQHLRK